MQKQTSKTQTARIDRPTRYKSAIITPAAGGYDLINPATGRWTHYRTQRAAKWWASVWSTVSESFEASTVREVPTINEENCYEPVEARH